MSDIRIAMIGYGEVGSILAEDLCARGVAVTAYDLKLDDPTRAAPLVAHAKQHGTRLAASPVEALRGAR